VGGNSEVPEWGVGPSPTRDLGNEVLQKLKHFGIYYYYYYINHLKVFSPGQPE